MHERPYSDILIDVGWVFAFLILDDLITDRILKFAAIVTISIACYAITSKPRANFVVFLVGIAALSAAWVNEDRIVSMVKQIIAQWFYGRG